MKKTIVFIILLLLLAAACLYYNCMLKDKYEMEKKEAVATAVQHVIDSIDQHQVLDVPEQQIVIHLPPPITHDEALDKQAPKISEEYPGNVLVDARDGQKYKIFHVNGLWWMAQNLNYETANSWCYDLDNESCDTWGRIYSWDAAMIACPDGWHLPDDNEWKSLIDYYGGTDYAGKALKAGGASDFNALMAGYRDKAGFFGKIDESTYFWSSTEQNKDYASFKGIYSSVDNVGTYTYTKPDGLSVRCVKNK